MGQTVTDEFHFLTRRLKQKLLYQIGMIDDAWAENDGFVLDDVYSQDPDDPYEVVKAKRSNSYDKLANVAPKFQKEKVIRLPSATKVTGEYYRKLVKPQHKYAGGNNKYMGDEALFDIKQRPINPELIIIKMAGDKPPREKQDPKYKRMNQKQSKAERKFEIDQRNKDLALEKASWGQDLRAFMRANKKMTYRARALRLM